MDNLMSKHKLYALFLVVLCFVALLGIACFKGVDRQAEELQEEMYFTLTVFEDGSNEDFLSNDQRTLRSFNRVATHLDTDGDSETVQGAEAVYVFNGTVSADSAIDSVAYVSNNPHVLFCKVGQNGKPILDFESNALVVQGAEAQKYCRIGVIIRVYDEDVKSLTTNNENELDRALIKELNDEFLTVRVSFSNGIELEKKYSFRYVDPDQKNSHLIIAES